MYAAVSKRARLSCTTLLNRLWRFVFVFLLLKRFFFAMSTDKSSSNWSPKRFDGSEYSKFRLRFILFLKRKEWHSAIDTPRPAVAADGKAEAWDTIDAKAQSILVDAVSDKILNEIQHETTVLGMLKILDATYLRKSLMLAVLAKRNLLNLRMADGESAQTFFSRFESHISALRDAGETVSAREKLSYLLVILPDKYSHIIDILDALPEESKTVDYVKGKMLFDHCKNGSTTEICEEGAAMKAQVTRPSARPRTPHSGYRCHLCGVAGHFKRDCRATQAQIDQYQKNGGHRYENTNRRHVSSNNIQVKDQADDHDVSEVSPFRKNRRPLETVSTEAFPYLDLAPCRIRALQVRVGFFCNKN